MNKQDRARIQKNSEDVLRKKLAEEIHITKHDSLNDRARKLGIATDMPSLNRETRRRDLRSAVRVEAKS